MAVWAAMARKVADGAAAVEAVAAVMVEAVGIDKRAPVVVKGKEMVEVGAGMEAGKAGAMKAGELTVEEMAVVPQVAAVVEASTSSERRKKCTARSVPRRQPPH